MPPFAVVLIGQPTLRKRMKHGVLAALDQGIAISYLMPTMSREETSSYIKHHITGSVRELWLWRNFCGVSSLPPRRACGAPARCGIREPGSARSIRFHQVPCSRF